MHVIKIIFGSGLAFLLFPFVCVIGAFCSLKASSHDFFDQDLIFAGFIAAFSLTHLTLFWKRLQTYGYAHRLRIPTLIAAVAIMSYNRHVDGWVDNSPFSSSITLFDQRIIGLCGYLRVIDIPNEEYGWFEFDFAGLFMNVEVLVFVIFLLALCMTLYDHLSGLNRGRLTPATLPEHTDPSISPDNVPQ